MWNTTTGPQVAPKARVAAWSISFRNPTFRTPHSGRHKIGGWDTLIAADRRLGDRHIPCEPSRTTVLHVQLRNPRGIPAESHCGSISLAALRACSGVN